MSEEEKGVKELREMLDAVLLIGLELVKLSRDGLSFSDLPALYGKMQQSPLKEMLAAASDRVGEVPDEVKDLDLEEGMELAMLMLRYLPKYLRALKT